MFPLILIHLVFVWFLVAAVQVAHHNTSAVCQVLCPK